MPDETHKILVVDDEPDLLDLLQYNLEREGYTVVLARDGTSALDVAKREEPDAIILDVMMPGLSGLDVAQRLRQNANLRGTPILMLTALDQSDDMVRGLEGGADAYLSKDVAMPVLMSQVRALLRSASRQDDQPETLRIHDLEISRDRYLVYRQDGGDQVSVRLPRKEFELLYFLASHPGKVFTRQDVLDRVWGSNVYVVDRTVDVHVRKIREKLGEDYIETVKGVGYRFRR